LAVDDGMVTGFAAGFSGVGVNSHWTVGLSPPAEAAAGAAVAGAVGRDAASSVVAIRAAGTNDRFMRST